MEVIPIKLSEEEALAKLNQQVAALVAKGRSIEVIDPATDLQAKQFRVECKSYEKAVDLFCDGDIQDATERVAKLRTAKKELLLPMEIILEAVDNNRKAWEEKERQLADKEGEKFGDTITIRPRIPTLQGVASTRRYKVAVEDEDEILLAWMKAKRGRTKKDAMLAMILRSYIHVDEKAIQAVARSEKGWHELQEQKIPGLKFWTE